MRKKITGIVILIFITAFAAGCGNKIPEMTEQQQELIVEYAAGTVLKYDKNYDENTEFVFKTNEKGEHKVR